MVFVCDKRLMGGLKWIKAVSKSSVLASKSIEKDSG